MVVDDAGGVELAHARRASITVTLARALVQYPAKACDSDWDRNRLTTHYQRTLFAFYGVYTYIIVYYTYYGRGLQSLRPRSRRQPGQSLPRSSYLNRASSAIREVWRRPSADYEVVQTPMEWSCSTSLGV